MPCDSSQPPNAAVVIFGDQTALSWLRFLKPGFRHCFVLIQHETGWVMVDSLAHWLHVAAIPPAPPNALAAWYRERGYRAIVTTCRRPPGKPAPPALLSCVEVVKRALGIHRFGIWTPHQLWRYLNIGKNS